ncbi:MAG: hypothetical protein EXS05_00330 [Planctomycetaceae bacterium]|nr:hypothetical protein [Planctomycetaceae bacterium]
MTNDNSPFPRAVEYDREMHNRQKLAFWCVPSASLALIPAAFYFWARNHSADKVDDFQIAAWLCIVANALHLLWTAFFLIAWNRAPKFRIFWRSSDSG